MDYFTMLVDQEFGKVPRDYFDWSILVMKRAPIAAVAEHLVGVRAIHINLWEQGEARIVALLNISFNLSICTRFLSLKLIAGECEDLESTLGELFVKLYHLTVVLIGQTSICCDVDDHNTLFTLNNAAQRFNVSANDVDGTLIEERSTRSKL